MTYKFGEGAQFDPYQPVHEQSGWYIEDQFVSILRERERQREDRERQRETERERERETETAHSAERERETKNPKQAPYHQHGARHRARTHKL